MSHNTFSIKRWWQNFGFGIQSKNDYEFLHDVLRERLPYYAYDELDNAFPDVSRREQNMGRLLFRVCNATKDKRIAIIGTYSSLEATAIAKALGTEPPSIEHITHFHNIDALIIKDIHNENVNLWDKVLENSHSITFDMQSIGIALFHKNRYPEHYKILRP